MIRLDRDKLTGEIEFNETYIGGIKTGKCGEWKKNKGNISTKYTKKHKIIWEKARRRRRISAETNVFHSLIFQPLIHVPK